MISRPNLARKLVLALCATGIALLLAEVAIRIFDIGPEIVAVHSTNYQLSDNLVLRYELVPGSEDGTTRISSHGLRDREYTIRKPPGTFRIACIGDSICYGLRVGQEDTFPSFLEEALALTADKEGQKVEVLNFGVTGYGFAQIMEHLRVNVQRFDPDLVIYAYCLNDPQTYSLEMANLLRKLTPAERDYVESRGSAGKTWRSESRLYLLSRFALRSSDEDRPENTPPVSKTNDQQFVALKDGSFVDYYTQLHTSPSTWAPVEDGLAELQQWVEDSGVPVMIALFPVLRNLRRYALSELHGILEERFGKYAFATVDLTACFAKYENRTGKRVAKRDSLHPSREGHKLTAIALLYGLLDAGYSDLFDEGEIGDAISESKRFAQSHEIVTAVRKRRGG
jgi:lysophospholipase L1-like esterase